MHSGHKFLFVFKIIALGYSTRKRITVSKNINWDFLVMLPGLQDPSS